MHDSHFGFITISFKLIKNQVCLSCRKTSQFCWSFCLKISSLSTQLVFSFLFLDYKLKRNLTWQSPCSMPNGQSHVQGLKFESGRGFPRVSFWFAVGCFDLAQCMGTTDAFLHSLQNSQTRKCTEFFTSIATDLVMNKSWFVQIALFREKFMNL